MKRLWQDARGAAYAVARDAARTVIGAGARPLARHWPRFSRLLLVSDAPNWVISWELRELAAIARQLGIRTAGRHWVPHTRSQAVFYGSQFALLDWPAPRHRVGMAYFHGRPGTGVAQFDTCYERLCAVHEQIQRLQVSHTEMRDIVLGSGIAPEKVFLIPIAINLAFFRLQTAETRRQARTELGIPQTAVVVGSFQKDGVGWGDGNEPKWVKGPDVFLGTIERLKPRIHELYVLLSGPARGYVKAGLERLGVPYRHLYVRRYPEVGRLFQALDVYVAASRQEGGPKAVLESMASGVPLVTTRAGQAMDLVRHGENGWMVEVEDADGLAQWAEYAVAHRASVDAVVYAGRRTAEANTYTAQLPLWRQLLDGFVERSA
jgi:glycosyltransferase involved in cell wall biosynthesis